MLKPDTSNKVAIFLILMSLSVASIVAIKLVNAGLRTKNAPYAEITELTSLYSPSPSPSATPSPPPSAEPPSSTTIIAFVVSAAVVVTGLLVYFKKGER